MPWGKHRGELIANVPSGYLVWLLEESDIAAPYRGAIREELADRLGFFALAAPVAAPPPEIAPVFREMVAAGFRAVAIRCHPDRGGSTAEMQRVNEVREWARRQGLC